VKVLWGVISDLDLARTANAPDFEERTTGEIAATRPLLVGADETLSRAAQLMSEHEVTHLIVCDRRSGRPIDVLSTLDVARAPAGSRDRRTGPDPDRDRARARRSRRGEDRARLRAPVGSRAPDREPGRSSWRGCPGSPKASTPGRGSATTSMPR